MENGTHGIMESIASAARKTLQFIGLSLAGIAIISNISNAQGLDNAKTKPAPWVPYNAASELINDPASLPTRPSEIGLSGVFCGNSTTLGTLSNYKMQFGGISAGIATSSSRTTDSKGLASDYSDLRLAAGTNGLQGGVKFQFSNTGSGFVPGQASFQARVLNQDIAGIRVRAGMDVAPRTKKQGQYATASADFIRDDLAFSAAVFAKGGKKPNGAFGIEANLGKGFQAGVSMHPERAFFSGRAQPNLMLRWTSKRSTFNANYLPHQKTFKVGIGMRI